MDILPLILTEDTLLLLTEEQQKMLARCSTTVIMHHIENYLQNPLANPKVVELVRELYKAKLEQRAFLKNILEITFLEEVRMLKYEDVGPHLGIDTMKRYIQCLELILNNSAATPYIAPVRKDLFDDFYFYLTIDERVKSERELKEFYCKVKKYKEYFYDGNNASYVGTAVKNILRERQMFEVILHGLKFQLEMIESQTNPASWRYL